MSPGATLMLCYEAARVKALLVPWASGPAGVAAASTALKVSLA